MKYAGNNVVKIHGKTTESHENEVVKSLFTYHADEIIDQAAGTFLHMPDASKMTALATSRL